MANKSVKRAFLASLMALILCISSLLGTTYAWFTDSVTSSNNIITSGNLDVELYYQKQGETSWTKVTEFTNIFKENTLWEPGHTEVGKRKVVNEGSLSLKYQLGINVASETTSTNVLGGDLKLSEFIKYGIVDGAQDYTREQAIAAVDATANFLSTAYNSGTTPLAAQNSTDDTDEKIVTMVVYMPTTVGNGANAKKGALIPTIHLGINLYATQYTAESDSFDDPYDEDAWHEKFEVATGNDLQAAVNNAQPGDTIVLTDDIVIDSPIVIPAAPATTFSLRRSAPAGVILDLNGKTFTNNSGYVIENMGNVVITGNGTFVGLGIIRSTAGSVVIENGNFYASSQWQNGVYQHTLKAENSTVVINGGNFDATVNGQTNAMFNASSNATITINGGSFKNVAGALGNFDPYLFTYEKDGQVIINNGTFYGGWRFNGETATTDIYGGSFTVGFDGQSFHANSTHKLTVYGGTFTPNTAYPNHSLAGKVEACLAKYYVANTVDGNIVVTPKPGSAKVAYRPYILDSWREAIQIDIENSFAMESYVVELWHNDTLLTTTTYAGKYPFNAPGYTTCCVAMPGSGFASWDTVIAEGVILSSANVPNAIKVYADGKLVDTFTHSSGNVFADKLNDYLNLDAVVNGTPVTDAESLSAALAADHNVILMNDITLPDDWTPAGNGTRNGSSFTGDSYTGVFDGNGYTINNVKAGLIGVLTGTVKNVTLVANINDTTDDSVGAVAGILVGGTVSGVTVIGTVSAPKAVGGIVGRILGDGTVTDCVNKAIVTSTGSSDAAGGIVGKAYYTIAGKEMNITKCQNTGTVSGGYAAGGIVGFSAANVIECTNSGTVTLLGASAASVGGIVGEQTNYGEISNNTNTADITASTGNGNAGGIIGWIRYQNNSANYPQNEVIKVSGNKNTGKIVGAYTAGGIVGLAYNQAIVTGNTNEAASIGSDTAVFAGGIVGGLQVDQNNLSLGGSPRFTVTGNTTTTAIEDIFANCKDLVAYNNVAEDANISGNTTN